MKITIDLGRAKDFVVKHKEAVAVAVIATLVIRRQRNTIQELNADLAYHGIGA